MDVEDLFQVRYERGIGLRRDHPVPDFRWVIPFLGVRRVVSWLADWTIPNAATLRANSRVRSVSQR